MNIKGIPRRYGVVTHQKGSWRWQDRYALIEYHIEPMRDGTLAWVRYRELDDKVTPARARCLVEFGYGGHPVNWGSPQYERVPTGILTVCGGAI